MAVRLKIDISFESDSEDDDELELSPLPKKRKDVLTVSTDEGIIIIRIRSYTNIHSHILKTE